MRCGVRSGYDNALRSDIVIPAKAGIQSQPWTSRENWIPAFAGMTLGGQLPRRHARRGVALMMALVTLFLLISVAVPYVLMTGYQEASALAYGEEAKARFGAQSAIDHTLARLRSTNRAGQFERWATQQGGQTTGMPLLAPDYDNPFMDSAPEFEIDIAGEMDRDFGPILYQPSYGDNTWESKTNQIPFSVSGAPSQGRLRQVWSAYAQDEQGKVNVNACTPALLGNLLGSAIVQSVTGMSDNCVVVMDEGADNFSEGPGHFVLESYLCSYNSRSASTFYGVHVSAPWNRDYASGTNRGSMFRRIRAPHDISKRFQGSLAVPLPAYLTVYQRLLSGGMPFDYFSVDQMRNVAELGVLRPGEASYDDAFHPAQWLSSRHLLTTHSYGPFDGKFFDPRLTTSVVDDDTSDLRARFRVGLASNEVLNADWLAPLDPRAHSNIRQIPPGVMVRLRYPSGHSLDAMSLGNGQFSSPFSTDPSQLIFTDVLAARFPILEMQELAPININTAPWEVLVAAVKGLRQGANWITQQDAEAFAAAVLHVRDDEFSGVRPPAYAELDMLLAPSESPYADQSQPLRWGGLRSDQELNILLGALVSAGEIGSYATSIIGQQQRYPYGGWPVVTAPFCYNTQGVMSIEGLATTFAGVGVDRGRARMKEIVEVGSDGPATWEWRDHRVIDEERSRPQGNHFYNSFSRTDGLRRLDRVELPWLLDPTAMVANGPQTLTLGGQTFISPLSVDQNKAFYTASTVKQVNIANGGAGQTEVADMRSGSLSFWYKMPVGFIGNQDTYVFDNGEGQYTDRISLLWWGGGRRAGRLALKPPGLTLRIKDRTLEQAFTAAHINVDPAKFREGNWYHFNVGWNGNEPGQMNVFIDGVSERGAGATETDHVFLDSQGAWVARTSKLMSDVPPELGNIGLGGSATDSINIDPNDVAAFPEPGVIRIGDEAISYTTKTGNGFTGLGRGARGTRAPQTGETPYPAGAKVTAFGYSVAVRNDSQSTHLPAGGALLADPLEGNGFYRVIGGDGTADAGYYAAEVIGPQVGFTNTTNFLPLDSMTGIPECGVMYVAGLCWKSYAQDPAGSGKLIPDHDGDGTPEFTSNGAVMTQGNYFDAEYILFTRAAGGVNVVQRYDASFNLKAAQDHYHFMGAWNGVTPADPLSVSTGGTPANYWEISGTVCLLVSARRNVDGAYHDPQAHSARQCRIQIDTEWLQYNRLISYGGYYLFVYTFGNQAFLGGKAVDRAQWHAQGLPVPGIDGFRELDANQNAVTRSVGTEIMPVFNIRGNRAGASDVVTVVAAPNNDKVERFIVRVETHGPYQNSNGNVISGHQYLGLHTNVLRDYPANSSELLRFPADPLPRGTPTRLRFGGMCYADAALGNAAATEVDELKFDGWPDGTFKVLVDIASTEKTGIVVRPTNGNLPESGLIKIGDELIMYRETTGTTADEFLEQPVNSGWWVQQTSNAVQLGKLSRGVLGTKTVAHARNILGMLVKNQPVYYTQGGIAADDHDISLTGHMAGVPSFGFMRAERSSASSTVSELFGFNSSANTGNNTYRVTTGTYHPQNWGALFRGSYGTTPQAWDSSAVIAQMPVRQPDFCPRWLRATKGQLSLSPEVSYLQGSQAFHNATINRLRWRMDARPQIELANYMGAKLFVRFDGAPDWDAVPDAAGPLYVFDFDWGRAQQIDDGGVKVYEQTIDFGSLLNRAVDQIEWRLVYYFQNNAYDADYWKGTLWFKGLLLDLDTETRILSHEEER